MKPFELQPTHENILATFEKDILGRNLDVLRFTELLNSIGLWLFDCVRRTVGRW